MTIRTLFSTRRPIDRPIEKVIDYYATDEKRLSAEVEEYEVTESVERCFNKFLEVYREGVQGGHVTEVGVWVAGFYGAGKSSFTKYLGFSLDQGRLVGGRPFLDLLSERMRSSQVKGLLRATSTKYPTAVILLDLGSEQLADATLASVSSVLYWKVLQWAGYSKEKKLAQLEFTLDERGLMDTFRNAYRARFKDDWQKVHNDPLIGVARASQIVPTVLPDDFRTPEEFSQLRFEEARDLRDRAQRMIDLVQRKSGKQNILFVIDEAGQYVAPRGDLILNLDGLARDFKEVGKGHVWIIATGQQTLAEIVEKAAHNSAELNKLRDRFPIAINLDAQDIREITYLRLLAKSPEGERQLKEEFGRQGQSFLTYTRLIGTSLFKGDPDVDTFAKLYPFLPQHFDLLMELIRTLARSTGGIGLRSAIRVIQDLLVDASRVLPAGTTKIADRSFGSLACVDDFYDSLRADLTKALPHVTHGVDRVNAAFSRKPIAIRVAKAIAALQAVEGFPKTPENIAALLYPKVGAPSLVSEVQDILRDLAANQECGITEDPQAGGFVFLSEGVKPLRQKRNAYNPTTLEVNDVRKKLLATIFDPAPSAKIENVKEIRAGVRYGKASIVGEDAEIQFRVEGVAPAQFPARRTELLADTNTLPELKNSIAWLVSLPNELDDLLVEAGRSEWIGNTPEHDADRDISQFLRAERRAAERHRDNARKLLVSALLDGVFIFQGRPTPVKEAGETTTAGASTVLQRAAAEVFPKLRLVRIRPGTDLAAKFLGVERLDRMPNDLDPLKLVARGGGGPRVDVNQEALAETLRVFREKIDESGSGRLQGNAIQDIFAAPPYGWSKDAVRYLFAALLVANEIELHTSTGVIRNADTHAQEAFKSTVAFNRAGVSLRGGKPTLEALDRAATRLQTIFGVDVLPSEDHIGRAVRMQVPGLTERIGSLPDRLRLLRLNGEGRARLLLQTLSDLIGQDGSAATAILGGADCLVPVDVKWARAVLDALDAGAEGDIAQARRMEAELGELQEMFPFGTDSILTQADKATISETLASDNFYETVPALRSAIRSTMEHLRSTYADRRSEYKTSLEQALKHLESVPDWARLLPEDREELAGRLALSGIPETPTDKKELKEFRLLLARSAGLSGLVEELKHEAQRRAPNLEPSRVPETPITGEQPTEQFVEVTDLLPPEVIRNTSDLEGWLSFLRTQLGELLRTNRIIRLKK